MEKVNIKQFMRGDRSSSQKGQELQLKVLNRLDELTSKEFPGLGLFAEHPLRGLLSERIKVDVVILKGEEPLVVVECKNISPEKRYSYGTFSTSLARAFMFTYDVKHNGFPNAKYFLFTSDHELRTLNHKALFESVGIEVFKESELDLLVDKIRTILKSTV